MSEPDRYATQVFQGAEQPPAMRYQALRPHARGGLGEVLVARDQELNREVALKQIQDRFADDASSRQRFVLEAEITGGLEHPGIVPVYGLGAYADGRPYYAMRFIRGQSLQEAAEAFHRAEQPRRDPGERTLELRKLLDRLIAVCNAIEYAHARGVVHRDLKPGNIMLGKFGETLVVDWGLAKLLDQKENETVEQIDERPLAPSSLAGTMPTQMGAAVGTPQYMSPEQAAGRLDLVGAASDVYSLGATLYYLLTGAPPFEAADLGALLQQVQRGEFRPPRQLNHSLPVELDAICRKAMALKPEDRYPSALALADDLEHWLADEPVSAYPESAVRRLGRWARRHRAWTLSGAAALLLISVVSATAAVWIDHERRRADENARLEAIARGEEAEQRKLAEQQARVANALRLAAQSREALSQSPQRSLLLAVAAVEISQRAEEPSRPEAHQMLRDALGQVGGRPLVGHQAALWKVAVSPDGRWLATGSGDQTARLWDLADADVKPRVLNHEGAVWAAAFSPDADWLATAGDDRVVRLWNLSDGQRSSQAMVLAGHSAVINSLAFSRDGRWLATASSDQTARLWDLKARQPAGAAKVLAGHESDVNVVAFSEDGRWLATAGDDHTARLWDLSADDPSQTSHVLRGHTGAILALAISADSHWLLTAGEDKTARVWNLAESAKLAAVLRGHEEAINAVAIAADSRTVATGSWDETVRVWDIGLDDPSQAVRVGRGHEEGVYCIALSPDGRWLASGSNDHTVRVWNLQNEQLGSDAVVLRGHEAEIRSLAITPDSRRVISAAGDTAARVWQLGKPDIAAPLLLDGHARAVLTSAISRDSRWLATGSADKTARLWKLTDEGAAEAAVLAGHEGGVWSVAFSPNGRWLATGSYDQTARLWRLTNDDPGASSIVLAGHSGPILMVAFSADDHWLATASADKTARLWNLRDQNPSASPIVLSGHADEITKAAFSPDHRWLITAGKDATARCWDLQSKNPAEHSIELRGHEGEISALAVSPDSRWCVTGGADGSVRVWNLDHDARSADASHSRL